MAVKKFGVVTHGDKTQGQRREEMVKLMKECPIPEDELLLNLGLHLVPQTLSRILFMDFLYRQILPVQGVIFDLGTRWGQNLSLFTSFRGIYEPFNRLRKIAAFDTFEGFNKLSDEDGKGRMMKEKGYAVTAGYEEYLSKVISLQEEESPLAHIKKHEIVKGDASEEVKKYLERNPETIISLAYFDFDLYKPTKEVLLTISDRLTKGSVIGFDEINDHECPGETLAVKEVFGLSRYSIKRFPYNSRTSYLIVE
ncbi:crotonobetainyl-CoA--carnitine CoA-transferase [bacterium]|nr:MAG: crotonobetainyl-CoA--carnitine CoA-transferase [bacterium]